MSMAGLKKQFHKASQLISEKVSGVEKTKLDEEFLEMQRKIEITSKAIVELLAKCTECLQPNPGQALLDFGESMKLLAEVKNSLDINVKQNFIEPLQLLQEKDLKEVGYHLKKLEGRRLDYDYKRRVSRISDEELQNAIGKFEESKDLARKGMNNLLENDIEQVSQLAVFVEAMLDYHRQSVEILLELHRKLQHRIRISSIFSNYTYNPSTPISTSKAGRHENFPHSSIKKAGPSIHMDRPCCRALYDFVPENEGELGFKEGDIITLTHQIDENWYEGIFEGQTGFFPINYVSVLVPLPH
ncbi:endophilin-A3 isoform X5 [Sarcophilus harrisii]|uniref:endophilin-A3 isoform X5 n=1 Tax=Sarcophilus harrisii TaxID=9305 RepID=UPI001301BB97|nr:endophilin-A3 isoform X5 [Sarcophilus harrisii]